MVGGDTNHPVVDAYYCVRVDSQSCVNYSPIS